MIQRSQVYKCNICGNIVEVLEAGGGQLVCCGQPMELLTEKTEDMGKEKHVPVIEKIDGKIRVKIGEIPHPMEEKHYIQWIELLVNDKIYRKFLKPGDDPVAEFELENEVDVDNVIAREYCNLHGLWIKK